MLSYAATACLALHGLGLAPAARSAALVSPSFASPNIMMAAKAPVKKVVKKAAVKKPVVKKVVKKVVRKAPVKKVAVAKPKPKPKPAAAKPKPKPAPKPAKKAAPVKTTFSASKAPVKKVVKPKAVNYSGRAPMPGSAISLGDIGTTAPLGVYDPLGFMTDATPKEYRRWQELEIKHGRLSMLAITHVLVTGAGIKWPGYCSYIAYDDTLKNLKWSDIPAGTLASFNALPALGWFQIIALCSIMDIVLLEQKKDKLPGDVIPDAIKEFQIYKDTHGNKLKFEQNLNRERNHGRAAMMGITGMVIHESLTGNPMWPIPYPWY